MIANPNNYKKELMSISRYLLTEEDAINFCSKLYDFKKEIFLAQFDKRKMLLNTFTYKQTNSILEYLNIVKPISPQDLSDAIDLIIKFIQKMKRVKIIIAIEATEEVLTTISDFFYSAFQQKVLLNIAIDKRSGKENVHRSR